MKTQNELGNDYEIRTGKRLNPKIKIMNVNEDQYYNETGNPKFSR